MSASRCTFRCRHRHAIRWQSLLRRDGENTAKPMGAIAPRTASWRFAYALRNTDHWERFLDLLVPCNRSWAKDAAALVVLISNSLMKPGALGADMRPFFLLAAATAYFAYTLSLEVQPSTAMPEGRSKRLDRGRRK